MTTTLEEREHDIRSGRLIVGGVLLALGAALLAAELGIVLPVRIWRWWPIVPLALGVSRLAFSTDPARRRGGFWLVVLGIWGGVCMLGLFGLGWGSSWPIWLIAIGLRIVLDGLRRNGPEGAHREA